MLTEDTLVSAQDGFARMKKSDPASLPYLNFKLSDNLIRY